MRPISVLRGISLNAPEHANMSSTPLTVMPSERRESRYLHSRCPYCSLHDSMNTKIYHFLQQKSINFEGLNGTTDYCKADFER